MYVHVKSFCYPYQGSRPSSKSPSPRPLDKHPSSQTPSPLPHRRTSSPSSSPRPRRPSPSAEREAAYVVQAGRLISKALVFEREKEFDEAFDLFKAGVDVLLNGVQSEGIIEVSL